MRRFHYLNSSNLSPELRLVIACLRVLPNDNEVHQIELLSKNKIEWHDFLVWVDRHRVAPLVYRNLSRYGGKDVPESIIDVLRSRFERNAHRSLSHATELVRLCKLFNSNAIPVLPLKGIILALQVYGNMALRHSGDIDLLVASHHVDLADHLLQESYQQVMPGYKLTPHQKKQFYRKHNHFEYIHNKNGILVELHWRLLTYLPLHLMNLANLQNRIKYQVVGGYPLPVMPWEETILYLCSHGARHCWFRLSWLIDLAEIIRQDRGTDWTQLLATAAEIGICRPLVQGVLLSHLLLNTPLPDAIQSYTLQDRAVPYLVRVAHQHILSPKPHVHSLQPHERFIHQSIHYKIFYLPRLCNNFRDKIHSLKNVLLDYEDWKTLCQSDAFSPFYHLLRPISWPRRPSPSRQQKD